MWACAEFAAVDPALEQLLGRKPATFRDVLTATLPLGGASGVMLALRLP